MFCRSWCVLRGVVFWLCGVCCLGIVCHVLVVCLVCCMALVVCWCVVFHGLQCVRVSG